MKLIHSTATHVDAGREESRAVRGSLDTGLYCGRRKAGPSDIAVCPSRKTPPGSQWIPGGTVAYPVPRAERFSAAAYVRSKPGKPQPVAAKTVAGLHRNPAGFRPRSYYLPR